MPIISMLYGIIIRMYLLDNKQHTLPHFHARYAEFEASITIEDGEIIAGELPRSSFDWFKPGLSFTEMSY